MNSKHSRFLLLAFAFASPRLAAESLFEEVHPVTAGWNLIHLGVEPLETSPAQALSGIDWESISAFITNLPPDAGGKWVSTFKDGPAFLNSLQTFTGPATYALLARGAGILRVKGRVLPDRQSLRGGGFDLYSPKVPSVDAPTLAEFLARPEVKDKIDGLFESTGAAFRKLLSTDKLVQGEGYWTLATQALPSPDPLVITSGGSGMHFTSQTTVDVLEFKVSPTDAPQEVKVQAIASADPTGSTSFLEMQLPDGSFVPIGASSTVQVPAGETGGAVTFRAKNPVATQPGGISAAAVVQVVGAGGSVQAAADLEVPALRGIWVGEARLEEVQRPSFHGGGFAPAPPMTFSLILEVPATGSPRLLPCAEVTVIRDERRLTYRLQSALFNEPLTLAGNLGADGKSGTLTGSVALGPEHPLNPYRHRYHPELVSGFDLQRNLTLRFGLTPPVNTGEGSPLATVGAVGGTYEEEINGLSREPIRVRGSFRFRGLGNVQVVPCQ
jgi:hypothetical protein